MKSAQVSQVFIYITSGIIIVAVLAFGVKMIFKITDASDDIACLKFKENLRKTIDSDRGYGTVDNVVLDVGCDYRKICFVDATPDNSGDVIQSKYPLIWGSWSNKVKQNVFFVNNVAEDFYYIENLRVPGGLICENITNAGVRVTLKGKGKHTDLYRTT